uniref:Cadherin-related family member 4 n=1 Tax=Accipiter nisus TaxID=211598 RepID=A0A8B9NFX6_9AVES
PAGEIRVVGPLDSEQHKSYRLTVQLTDIHNDLDPAKRRSRLCEVTVHLQTLRKEPLVIVRAEAVWHPPAWFVAVLTVSGTLLLAALGCMTRTLLGWGGRPACCFQASQKGGGAWAEHGPCHNPLQCPGDTQVG